MLPDIIDLTEDAQDNVFVKNIDNEKSLSPRHDSVTDIEVDSSKRESGGMFYSIFILPSHIVTAGN